MPSFKVLLALLLFFTGAYKFSILVQQRKLFEPLQMRSSRGFVRDNAPPLVVTAKQAREYRAKIERMKNGIAGEAAKELSGIESERPKSASKQAGGAQAGQAESTSGRVRPTEQTSSAGSKQASQGLNSGTAEQTEQSHSAATDAEPRDPNKKYYKVNCEARNESGLMPDVVWRRLVEKAGKRYVVLQADTDLTQVSVENFGGEGCWPKLWSLNPEIQNPHKVPGGTKVVFGANR